MFSANTVSGLRHCLQFLASVQWLEVLMLTAAFWLKLGSIPPFGIMVSWAYKTQMTPPWNWWCWPLLLEILGVPLSLGPSICFHHPLPWKSSPGTLYFEANHRSYCCCIELKERKRPFLGIDRSQAKPAQEGNFVLEELYFCFLMSLLGKPSSTKHLTLGPSWRHRLFSYRFTVWYPCFGVFFSTFCELPILASER